MSYATGTAINHTDFLTKLIAFLTTDATLVGDGQNWTQVWNNADSSEIVLKGPGLDGLANVFVGISRNFDPAADSFYILFHGMTDIVASATAMAGHINVSPSSAGVYVDANPQTYWFVANGRRFIVTNKISTVYETAYAGLYLPYALPTTYPYPFLLAGSRARIAPGTPSWRSLWGGHAGLAWPGMGQATYNPSTEDTPNMMFLDPEGVWVPVVNYGNVSLRHGSLLPISAGIVALQGIYVPNPDQADDQFLGHRYACNIMRPAFGGDYMLIPLTLAIAPQSVSSPPYENETLGVLDGVYWTQGSGNAAENTIDVDSVEHLVVQNVFRTTNTDYIAIALG